MLAIRLRRSGAKKDPHYRIVVTERSAGRDGRFLEILGHYHPRSRPAEVTLDVERTEEWVSKGAQMSSTVSSLLQMMKSGGVPAEKVVEPAAPAAPAAAEEIEAAAEAEASEDGAAESEAEADAEESADDAGEEE